MHQTVLQNKMALAVLTAAQGETCTLIKTECCVYIPDITKIFLNFQLTDTHIGALNDLSISFNNCLNSWTKERFCQLSKDSYLGLFSFLLL